MAGLIEDRNEWPSSSAKYHLREHRASGDGLQGLVFNSLIDQKEETFFSDLSDKEMYYHLHVTNLYNVMTVSKSRDVCEATVHGVKESHEQHEVKVSTTKASFNESIRSVLSDHCSSSTKIESLVQGINKVFNKRTRGNTTPFQT